MERDPDLGTSLRGSLRGIELSMGFGVPDGVRGVGKTERILGRNELFGRDGIKRYSICKKDLFQRATLIRPGGHGKRGNRQDPPTVVSS